MGIIAVFLSTIFATTKDVFSKELSARIDGMSSTFASFGFALPFYLIVLAGFWLLGYDIFTFSMSFWWLVLARAITDVFAEGMKMYAFSHGDMSLVAVIFSLSPLFVVPFSLLFLPEDHLSPGGILAVVLVVLGSVALVYRPSRPDWGKQKKAIVLATGAAIFFALNSIFDRSAMSPGSDLPPMEKFVRATVGGFSMTALSALLICPFILFRPDRMMSLYVFQRSLLIRGFLEVAFMICKLAAVIELPVAYVTGIFRASLLLSIIAGRFYFKETDFGRRMLAGLLIIAGVAWILWEQAR